MAGGEFTAVATNSPGTGLDRTVAPPRLDCWSCRSGAFGTALACPSNERSSMSKSLRWIVVATVALVTSMAFTAGALAQAPKFHSATSSVNNDGALVVSWDERGLGNGDIDYTLTADATAVYACINRGGNHPEAANKET